MTTSTSRLPQNRSRTSTQATSVPITALTTATTAELPTVRISATRASRLVNALASPLQPAPLALATTAASGSSTSRLSQMTASAETGAPRPAPRRRPAGTLAVLRRRPGEARRWWARGHPPLSILVTIPFVLSKYFALTAVQPPRSAIVVELLRRSGTGCVGSFAPLTVPTFTPATTGRNPALREHRLPGRALDVGQERGRRRRRRRS